jgi:predicted phosphodiesterase
MRITDWLRRRQRRTLQLPASGTAFIVSDMHGGLRDWRAFLRRTDAIERISGGEDLHVVITGDVPDVTRHRAVDEDVPPDGDVRILESIVEAQARLGARGRRLVYVEGNHDFHVARICQDVARFAAIRDDRRPPGPDELPAVDQETFTAFCEHYQEIHGEAIYQNNIAPYDMVARARSDHLRLIKSGPIIALLGDSGVAVVHAGPPRMAGRDHKALRREIDRAKGEDLRHSTPEEYFSSAYHQLLNNRFRHGDYDLDDLEQFLHCYNSSVLVSGHTPHPYLLDFERQAPLENCGILDGVGHIGSQQIVLCTSFGAFLPAYKRYLEVDLTRNHADIFDVVSTCARPLYEPHELPALSHVQPLPGTDIVAKL